MLLLNALKKGNIALAQRLITQGNAKEINAQDDNGISPLHYCVLKSWHAMAESLLKHGAKLNVTAHFKHNTYMTPLHLAALLGNKHFVELLLKWGADADLENGEYQTASQVAEQHNYIDISKLINRGNKAWFNQYSKKKNNVVDFLEYKLQKRINSI